MRKSTVASIASLCMVPALFWSQDSSAVPAFARKYQTSCYTCHSGFPNRNAFGEAFKNNGYRWPGGEDEDHAKQEQTKMGANGWKQTFPETPWPSDIPGFAPFALYITGPLVNYADAQRDNTGAITTKSSTGIKQDQTLNWGGPVDARILFGGTIGENLGVVGEFGSFHTGAPVVNVRAIWSFAPGVNLSFGNSAFMSSWAGLATPISSYTAVFPTANVGPEFNYVVGKEGGLNITAGLSGNVAAPYVTTTTDTATTKITNSGTDTDSATTTIKTVTAANLTPNNKLDDYRYVRVKYKLFGAGLLSGAGGTYGNEYVGLDNSLAIGASLLSARDGMLSYGGGLETLVYGVDIAGNYGSFTGGVAYSKDRDLALNNYTVDAGYYIYPWLLARVKYTNLGQVGDLNNPTYTPSLTAWLRANVSLQASYVAYGNNLVPSTAATTGVNNQNTFKLNFGYGF